MSERYLITGAQGFVGRHVVREALRSADVSVLGIGRSVSVSAPALPRGASLRYAYTAVDVRNSTRLAQSIRRFAPTTIVHLASGLRDDPLPDLLRINVAGTLSLLDALKSADIAPPRLVIGSSGGVYGCSTRLPLTEDAACVPIDLYSASKLAQEHVSLIVGAARGLDVIVARLFNLIGPGQDERHACSRFARQLVETARSALPVPLEVGDLTPTRDFIDVRDAASAMLLLGRDGQPGQVYNVASGVETSIRTLLELVCAAVGVAQMPDLARTYHRGADIPRHVADVRKLQAIGHRRRYELECSVRDLVAHYRAAA